MEGFSSTIPVPWLFMRAVYCGPISPFSACSPSVPVAMITLRGHLPHPPAWGLKSATWSAALPTQKGSTHFWMTCWLQTCTSASTPCWAPWCPWTRAGRRPWISCRKTPRATWRETGPNWLGSAWCSGQSAQLLAELRTGWVRGSGRWSNDGCEVVHDDAPIFRLWTKNWMNSNIQHPNQIPSQNLSPLLWMSFVCNARNKKLCWHTYDDHNCCFEVCWPRRYTGRSTSQMVVWWSSVSFFSMVAVNHDVVVAHPSANRPWLLNIRASPDTSRPLS